MRKRIEKQRSDYQINKAAEVGDIAGPTHFELKERSIAKALERKEKRKATQRAYRQRLIEAVKEMEAEQTPEELAAAVEALRARRRAQAANRARIEAALPQEEREALAAERAAQKAAYYARKAVREERKLLTPEEKAARKEAAKEKIRARSKERYAALAAAKIAEREAAGLPPPKRGRPRKDPGDATEEELKEAARARNREAQRRFKARKQALAAADAAVTAE